MPEQASDLELDELRRKVAEKVFGIQQVSIRENVIYSDGSKYASGRLKGRLVEVPDYSGRISAAFEVAERMRVLAHDAGMIDFYLTLDDQWGDPTCRNAEFAIGEPPITKRGQGQSWPEAICKAALEAAAALSALNASP